MHQATRIESKLYQNGTHGGGDSVENRQDETQIRVGLTRFPFYLETRVLISQIQ